MAELVGIVNVTPDSFSDGGQFYVPELAIVQARQLFADGAALVDLGAESTRPGATPVTPAEERRRLEPVLEVLLNEFPGKISLDSYHPQTFEWAFSVGSVIMNDVTGMSNPAMRVIAAQNKARVIISHLPSTDIQRAHQEMSTTSVAQVKHSLLARKARLVRMGVPEKNIILDPGIGFDKSPELNRELLAFASEVPGHAVMIGYSKKRFLGENRLELEPNLEAGRIAADNGAMYLRVHDVAGHRELLGDIRSSGLVKR